MSGREWLIRKSGYYYRRNRSGYTASPVEAGRYTEEEARAEAAVEPWCMSAVHISEVPDATPSPAAEADLEAIQAAEREKIARQIEEEADLTPCVEDANVIRHLATLVRAKFSYDQADRIEAAEDDPTALLAEVARLRTREAELVAGLRPLGAIADNFPDGLPDDTQVDIKPRTGRISIHRVLEDFRRARALINGGSDG